MYKFHPIMSSDLKETILALIARTDSLEWRFAQSDNLIFYLFGTDAKGEISAFITSYTSGGYFDSSWLPEKTRVGIANCKTYFLTDANASTQFRPRYTSDIDDLKSSCSSLSISQETIPPRVVKQLLTTIGVLSEL